jgi:hypothetical protein
LLHVLTPVNGTLSRSLRCGDPVRLQGYFCRAGDAPGRRTIDPGRVKTPKGRFQRRIVFYRCRDFHAGLP